MPVSTIACPKDFKKICGMNGHDSSSSKMKNDNGVDDESENNNFLDFSNFPLYGRKEELQLLNRIYRNVCEGEEENVRSRKRQQVPIPIIAGFSGTGKSTLVERFIDGILCDEKKQSSSQKNEKANKPNISLRFLCGKYCEMKCEDPFSAIVGAFCGFLLKLQADTEELEIFKNKIHNEIGAEVLKVLSLVIPDLNNIIKGKTTNISENSSDTVNKIEGRGKQSAHDYLPPENTRNRLKYAFQTLFKAICNDRERPVVMFLDDLQWADNASIDLMSSLLKDASLRHFMFIGALRSDEVDNMHPLSLLLDELSGSRAIEKIHLPNLSLDELGEFICNLLGLYSNEAAPLTDVVYRKTKGNIFFAVQMLKEFEQRNVLYWSKKSFRWEWDFTNLNIMNDEDVSENVVDVVARRIKNHSSEKLQKVLSVAAYVRSNIDLPILQIVMEATGYKVNSNELIELLDDAVVEGILSNSLGSESYKFVHDQIQQAARSLIAPGAQRDQLREKVGQCLFKAWVSSMNKSTDWMLFVAADHLTTISSQQENDRNNQLQTVRISVEAGEKAFALGSFVQASKYLKLGLDKLKCMGDNNHWVQDYELSLRLHRALVDAELVLGHFELGSELANELFNNTKCNNDKVPTYISLSMALGREARSRESLDLCWTALRMLGEKPKKSIVFAVLMKDFMLMKLFFKKTSDDKILAKPLVKDEIKVTALRFYDEAAARAHICGERKQALHTVLRGLRLSFKYGLSASTAMGIAYFSVFVGMFGDQQMALRLARLAKKVTILTKAKNIESRVLMVATRFTEDWSCPTPSIIKTYEQGHKIGMEIGDTEFAFYNLICGIRTLYNTGHSLARVETAFAEALRQCQIYNVQVIILSIGQMLHSVLHLKGRSGIPNDWQKMDEYDFADSSQSEGSSNILHCIFACLSRLELAVYFGEYCCVEAWVKLLKEISQDRPNVDIVVNRLFYSGLACLGLARKTGSKKYIEMSKQEAKELKKKIKAREAHTYSHRCLIMEAALMTLCTKRKNSTSIIKESFVEAIDAAIYAGHLHDAALGSELAGEYFLGIGEVELSTAYLTKARDFYHEWGAFAKVEHIQTKHGCFVSNATLKASPTINNNIAQNCANNTQLVLPDLMQNLIPNTFLTKDLRRIPEDMEIKFDDMSHMTELYSHTTELYSASDSHEP